MKRPKLPGVSHALVSIARISGEQFEHARLILYGSVGGESIAAIEFQAHRLDYDRYGSLKKPDPMHDRPDHRLDFGAHPYGPHYGATWTPGRRSTLSAAPMYSGASIRESLALVAKIQDRIAKIVDDRNLARIEGRSHCELGIWINALEALNVPVELNRYVQTNGEAIKSISELPEKLRHPGFKFIEATLDGPAENNGYEIKVQNAR